MNTKMLRKIALDVKFEVYEEDGKTKYKVSQKNFKGEWICLLNTTRLARALHRKHNAYLHVIGNIGKRPWLLERRKKRKISAKRKFELVTFFKEQEKELA